MQSLNVNHALRVPPRTNIYIYTYIFTVSSPSTTVFSKKLSWHQFVSGTWGRWPSAIEVLYCYLNVFFGWFLWVLIRRSSNHRPSLSSQYLFLPFSVYFPSILCVFWGDCVWVNVVKGVSSLNRKTHKQPMLHPLWVNGLERFFFLSFPLSWEHAALWSLSREVVSDFARSKKMLYEKERISV